jgi:hypothetical protein
LAPIAIKRPLADLDTFEGPTRGQSYIAEANTVGAADPSDWNNAAEAMVV